MTLRGYLVVAAMAGATFGLSFWAPLAAGILGALGWVGIAFVIWAHRCEERE